MVIPPTGGAENQHGLAPGADFLMNRTETDTRPRKRPELWWSLEESV